AWAWAAVGAWRSRNSCDVIGRAMPLATALVVASSCSLLRSCRATAMCTESPGRIAAMWVAPLTSCALVCVAAHASSADERGAAAPLLVAPWVWAKPLPADTASVAVTASAMDRHSDLCWLILMDLDLRLMKGNTS